MKKLAAAILIFNTLTAMSQEAEMILIEKIYHNTTYQELQIPSVEDKNASNAINQILSNLELFPCNDDEENKKYLQQAFRIIDINHDGDLDLIFNGRICPGFESEIFQLYLNINGTYIKKIDETGRLFSYDKNTIIIFTPPCCGNENISFDEYDFSKDNVQLRTSVNLPLYYNDNKNLPEIDYKLTNREQITIYSTDSLYYYPMTIEQMNYNISRPNYSNNLFGIVKTQANAIMYLNEFILKEDQRRWQLVLVSNKDLVLKNAHLEPNQYTLVWRLLK